MTENDPIQEAERHLEQAVEYLNEGFPSGNIQARVQMALKELRKRDPDD